MNEAQIRVLRDRDDYKQLYDQNDREDRIKSVRLGCKLVMALMPVGVLLDYVVYEEFVSTIFLSRIVSSIWAAVIFGLTYVKIGKKSIKTLSVLWIWVASISMGWMIYITEGSTSPYYAGQNLAILVVFAVMPWAYKQAIISCIGIMAIYVLSCLLHTATPFNGEIFISNMYFVVLTTVICIPSALTAYKERISKFDSNVNDQIRNNELEHIKDKLELSLIAERSQKEELQRTKVELELTTSQLVKNEKIKVIDLLSGGLLHEINNPLNNSLVANAAALSLIDDLDEALEIEVISKGGTKNRKLLEETMEIKGFLGDVKDSLRRVTDTISSLRTFAHPSSKENGNFRVQKVINMSLKLLSNKLTDISVEKIYQDKELTFNGQEDQFSLVLINLLTNSEKALQGRDNPIIKIQVYTEGENHYVKLWDNGTGIDKNIIEDVFDPFFTTREVNDGMGLGLNMCQQILRHHAGDITVESKLGEWTEFTLSLPITSKKIVEKKQEVLK